ncbi:FAD-dependent monooxygenase [Streptomyces sp. IBSBF 2953]|nr:FAD-dependent monooxygenase [Streptomyces hayashii]
MTRHYDVVVVGARCAGASISYLLAQSGLSVLLLDAAALPSGTMSTLYLQPQGVALLREWGLLETVMATGCTPIREIVYRAGETVLRGAVGGAEEFGCAPERADLDGTLVEAAVAFGVEFRDRARVHELIVDEGRVRGVRYKISGSREMLDARCLLVIGADGMRSTVARLVGAADLHRAAPASCVYYALHPAVDDTLRLFEEDGLYATHIPTTKNQAVLAAYFPQHRFPEIRQDARRHYVAALASFSELQAHLRDTGGVFHGFTGTGDQQNYLRQTSGPGWSLLGDAAHHKDSITALGMSDALGQAAVLSESVADSVHDPALLDEAIRRCWADRHDVLLEHGAAAHNMASLYLSPRRRALLNRIKATGLETGFFAVMEGRSSLEGLMGEIEARQPHATTAGGGAL